MKNKMVKGFAPFGVFVVAIAGAFMTTSMGSTTALSQEQGYLHTGVPTDPCAASIMCENTETSDFCRVGTQRLYGLTAPKVCNKTLWRID